jgi:hypothetical protein
VIGQHDIVKHIMQRPVLGGQIGRWAYSLVEYDLMYEPLRAVKGQIVADFIVDYDIKIDDVSLVVVCPWKLYFVGSVCDKGCGVGCMVQSPNGSVHELSNHLEFECTNNQIEFEALLTDLEFLIHESEGQ